MGRLLQFLGLKTKAKPPTSSLAEEALTDMKLRAMKDELQSLRGDLNDRIDRAFEAIEEVRTS